MYTNFNFSLWEINQLYSIHLYGVYVFYAIDDLLKSVPQLPMVNIVDTGDPSGP